MSLIGLYIIGAGIVLGFLGFFGALLNMGLAASGADGNPVTRHLTAMGFMALGGVVGAVGALVAVIDAIKAYG